MQAVGALKMGHIMQRIFPLMMIVSVALLALPATATPFWTGRRIAGTVVPARVCAGFFRKRIRLRAVRKSYFEQSIMRQMLNRRLQQTRRRRVLQTRSEDLRNLRQHRRCPA
jgi:hypothetical protein